MWHLFCVNILNTDTCREWQRVEEVTPLTSDVQRLFWQAGCQMQAATAVTDGLVWTCLRRVSCFVPPKSIMSRTSQTFHQTWEHILLDTPLVVKLIRLSVCCRLCDDESVKGNNEPSPVCDPRLMLPAAACVPFSLTSINVSKQQLPIKQPHSPFLLM